MTLSRFSLPDWTSLAGSGAVPEALVAAVVSAIATLALVAGFAPRLGIGASASGPVPEEDACDFVIEGASVRPVTAAARTLLAGLPRHGNRLAALAAHLGEDWPDAQAGLEGLVLYGTPFQHHAVRDDGEAFVVVGEPRDRGAFVSIRAASEEARSLRDAQAALARTAADRDFLRDVLDRAPVLAWSRGPDGQISNQCASASLWPGTDTRRRVSAPRAVSGTSSTAWAKPSAMRWSGSAPPGAAKRSR